ncbi:MAG: helix-turn-helix transcriptional regulator [Verrucomicrobia bacterium]|nr:helix-turn-helix transcriptional regulator [Verrucomicrobiota bacterium]
MSHYTQRSRWFRPSSSKWDLFYLGWGRRFYGRYPCPPKRHEGWGYTLICKGNPTFTFKDAPIRASQHEILLVHPACVSGLTDEGNRTTTMLSWVWNNPPPFREIEPAERGFRKLLLDPDTVKELAEIHRKCRREVREPDDYSAAAIRAFRSWLDLCLVRSAGVDRRRLSSEEMQIRFAVRWMRENLSVSHPIASLCDYLQISSSNLHRLFVRQVGESPVSHYHKLKMIQAQKLLKSGMSVKEVAWHLAYQHPNDFSRAFKIFLGRSPTKLLEARSG